MALKIRLTRMGSTHRPFYRLIVIDSRSRRDGRGVSTLGYYNPVAQPAEVKIEAEEALGWLQKGAQPSDTAKSLLKQHGIWQRFQLLKQGKSPEEVEAEVAKILETRNQSRANAAAAAEAKAKAKAEAEAKAKAEAEEKAAAEAAAAAAAAEAEAQAQEAPAEEAASEEAPAAEETPAEEKTEA
ncbi:MAG: 30S ribosomal protein S16 [Candidatus Omnitrophica bacterium]|nr:30S ribosomal protein S16 [Candidatus Omnitrophota bacterium]MCB9783068.1 30S ribosomal protein S16 [Candidatus Omnitrophota bacterium]